MKQFNLDEYLKNPSKKVVTRDGRNVKIHCTNCIGTQPVIAEIEGENRSSYWGKDGRYLISLSMSSINDLFFASTKHEEWINVYRDRDTGITSFGGILYTSREEAEEAGKTDIYYVSTAKIEWEE